MTETETLTISTRDFLQASADNLRTDMDDIRRRMDEARKLQEQLQRDLDEKEEEQTLYFNAIEALDELEAKGHVTND